VFLGSYEHTVDSKNRLRLPKKFKRDFLGEVVLTKGNDACLFVLPKENFDDVFKKAENMPLFDSKAQKPLRLLFSSASVLEEDNQGRFLLPQSLKVYAGIEKEVVFVGVGSRIELWSKESWEKYSNGANFDETLKALGEYGNLNIYQLCFLKL